MCYNVPWFDRFFQLEVLLMWAKRCVSLLLAAALDLLCRYFRRAKAVSDDNESII